MVMDKRGCCKKSARWKDWHIRILSKELRAESIPINARRPVLKRADKWMNHREGTMQLDQVKRDTWNKLDWSLIHLGEWEVWCGKVGIVEIGYIWQQRREWCIWQHQIWTYNLSGYASCEIVGRWLVPLAYVMRSREPSKVFWVFC